MTSKAFLKIALCLTMLTTSLFHMSPSFAVPPASNSNLTQLKSELKAISSPLSQTQLAAQEDNEAMEGLRNNAESGLISGQLHLFEIFMTAVDSLLMLDRADPKFQHKAQEAATSMAQVKLLLPGALYDTLNDREARKFISPNVQQIAKTLNSQLSQALQNAQQSLRKSLPGINLEQTTLVNPYTQAMALIKDKYDMQPPFDAGYFAQMKAQLNAIAQQTQQALSKMQSDFEKEKSQLAEMDSIVLETQIEYYKLFIEQVQAFLPVQKNSPQFQEQTQLLTTFLSDFRLSIPVTVTEQYTNKAYEELLSEKVRESAIEMSLFLLEKSSQAHFEIAKGVKGVDLNRTSLNDMYENTAPKSNAKPPEYKKTNYMQLMRALNSAEELGKPTAISLRSISSPGFFQFRGMVGRNHAEAHQIEVAFTEYFKDPKTGHFALNPNSISVGVFSAADSKFKGLGSAVGASYKYQPAADAPEEDARLEFFKNGRITENTFLSTEAYGRYQSVRYAKGVLTLVNSERMGTALGESTREVQIAKVQVDPEFKQIGSVNFETYEEVFMDGQSIGLRAQGKFHNLKPLQLMLKDYYPPSYGSELKLREKTANDLELSQIENITSHPARVEKAVMILDPSILQKIGAHAPSMRIACWKAHPTKR